MFTRCESIFQLINRVLTEDNHDFKTLIEQLRSANTCARAYFTIQTENG
jgi:hypothetical protein